MFKLRDLLKKPAAGGTSNNPAPTTEEMLPEMSETERQHVYRFLEQSPDSNVREICHGVRMRAMSVIAVLKTGERDGDLTATDKPRGEREYRLKITTSPIEETAQPPVPPFPTEPVVAPPDLGGGLLQAGTNARAFPTVSQPDLTSPDLAQEAQSSPKSEPASGVIPVLPVDPQVDPRMKMVLGFLVQSGQCTLREICGGTSIPAEDVNRLLNEGIAAGTISHDGGFENRRRFMLVTYQPKPVEAPVVAWVHPDIIWSNRERLRVLNEEKLKHPEPPIKRPPEPQLSDFKQPTVVWTEEMERDYQIRHKDRRNLKY